MKWLVLVARCVVVQPQDVLALMNFGALEEAMTAMSIHTDMIKAITNNVHDVAKPKNKIPPLDHL